MREKLKVFRKCLLTQQLCQRASGEAPSEEDISWLTPDEHNNHTFTQDENVLLLLSTVTHTLNLST